MSLRLLIACLALWLSAAGMTALAQGEAHGVIEAAPAPDGSFWTFVSEVLSNLFNSRGLMETLGKPQFAILAFVAMNVIVFVETGLLVGFFLPGDSLLVTAGLIASNPVCAWNVWLLMGTLCVSAILGDSLNYSIGFRTGPAIFNREDSYFFKKDHLIKAHQFYERHGGKTIILARFMPIIRTFAPAVAGVGRMHYPRFLLFNVVGGVAWVVSMVGFGYLMPSLLNPPLARIFGAGFLIQDHVEKVVIVVVLLSISPGVYVWARNKWGSKKAAPASGAA